MSDPESLCQICATKVTPTETKPKRNIASKNCLQLGAAYCLAMMIKFQALSNGLIVLGLSFVFVVTKGWFDAPSTRRYGEPLC